MIYLAHMGRLDGRDPASLWKFVKMLGRTEITAKCPNLNTAHDLLTQASEAHVLAALIERCGVTDLNSLSEIIASGQRRTQVEEMGADWLQLKFVDSLRDTATSKAEWSLHESQHAALGDGVRRKKPTKSDLASETLRHRDIVFENAILFLVHSLIYIDFHDAIRVGDSGRVEKNLDIRTIMFQGSGSSKSNYRNLTLDFKASRVKEWTTEMHELWLYVHTILSFIKEHLSDHVFSSSNCLLNLSGQRNKFITIDEFNEYEVMCLKSTYNPTGTFQSTKFTCNVVSPNIMSLRNSTHGILQESGAPSGGYAHTHPDDLRDVFAILGQLLKEKVFQYTPSQRTSIETKPSRDLYSDGVMALCTTDILAKFITKKIQRRGIPGDEVLKGTTQEGEEEDPATGAFSENLLSWDLGTGDDGREEFGIELQVYGIGVRGSATIIL